MLSRSVRQAFRRVPAAPRTRLLRRYLSTELPDVPEVPNPNAGITEVVEAAAAEATTDAPTVFKNPIDAVDLEHPKEMAADGTLSTVYVNDTELLDPSQAPSTSPEDDLYDKSIKWEPFKRADMYKLLKHVDDAKTYGLREYAASYAPVGERMSEADFQYLAHMQTESRIIANNSDDEAGYRMAEARRARFQGQKEVPTFKEWAQDNLTTEQHAQHKAELEALYADEAADMTEKRRLAALRHPPRMNPDKFRASADSLKTQLNDENMTPLLTPYSFEDWEHELRSNYLLRAVRTSELPPMAEKALAQRHEARRKPPLLSPAMELSKYTDLGDSSTPIKEYHLRMLRLYGSHFELGEPYQAPAGALPAEMSSVIEASIASAQDWTEGDAQVLLNASEHGHGQKRLGGDNDGPKLGAYSSDEDEFDENTLTEDMKLDAVEGNRMRQAKEAQKAARSKAKKAADDQSSLDYYHKMLDSLEFPIRVDCDYSQEEMVDEMIKAQTAIMGGKVIDESANYNDDVDANVAAMGFKEDHTDSDPEEDEDGNDIDLLHGNKKMTEGQAYYQVQDRQEGIFGDDEKVQVDAQYQHLDKYERMIVDALKHGSKEEEETVDIAGGAGVGLEAPKVFAIHTDVKEAIHRLHVTNPVKYHSRELARMFGLSVVRTQAILKMQYLEEQMVEKFGYNIEDEFNVFEMEELFKVELAQWDPEFFDNRKFTGVSGAANDGELEILRRIEKQRVDKYWKKHEHEALKEQADYQAGRAQYATNMPALPPPMPLQKTKQDKARAHVVLTDITDAKKGNYRISVRDTNGLLREANEVEYRRVRFREKSSHQFFNHVPYKFNEKI